MRLLTTVGLLLAITQPPAAVDPILSRLDAYLTGYEPKLSELIADELMMQEIPRAGAALARETGVVIVDGSARRRRIESEVAFIALPNGGWLGFRHVKTVNRRAVESSDTSLGAVLQRSALESARALVEASAAHNLGLPRTTNLPNLPLEFLQPRNRQRLLPRLDGTERVRGVETTKVVLIERMSPTLIRNPDGSDMPSVIRAWINPGDGRLMRAEVTTFPSFGAMQIAENNIRVEFSANKTLGLLVPTEMREKFPVAGEHRGSSVASYTNFRRFTTSARIVQ